MPFVSITRLRVRSWSYLPAFVVQTLRIARQAARADGNLAVKLLRDHRNAFLSGTSWSAFCRGLPAIAVLSHLAAREHSQSSRASDKAGLEFQVARKGDEVVTGSA